MKKAYEFSGKRILIGKVGEKIIMELEYMIKEHSELDSIAAQEEVKKK